MKDWFDYTLEERIEINKKQGFTVDNLYPKGTKIRASWDKMIEETEKNLSIYFDTEKLKFEKKISLINLSPEELLKKKT